MTKTLVDCTFCQNFVPPTYFSDSTLFYKNPECTKGKRVLFRTNKASYITEEVSGWLRNCEEYEQNNNMDCKC